jgi:hypothetical protein
VTQAHQAPLDHGGSYLSRRAVNEAGRPTTLSLIKSSSAHRCAFLLLPPARLCIYSFFSSPKDAIAALEAKLKQMERASAPPTSGLASGRPLAHPLPAKPAFASSSLPSSPYPRRDTVRPPNPSAPLKQPVAPAKPPEISLSSLASSVAAAAKKKPAPVLKGVKLVRKRDKEGPDAGGEASGS